MSKQIYLTLVSIIFIFISENTIAQIKDVDGWFKAKWGMTEKQIINTFGSEVKKRLEKNVDPTIYEPLGIPSFKIENNVYNVYFHFDSETKKLVEVKLYPTGESNYMPLITFKQLDQSLKFKYGNPSDQSDSDQSGFSVNGEILIQRSLNYIHYDRKWIYPSTIIKLSYLDFKLGGKAILSLTYTSKQKRYFNVYDEVPKQKLEEEKL